MFFLIWNEASYRFLAHQGKVKAGGKSGWVLKLPIPTHRMRSGRLQERRNHARGKAWRAIRDIPVRPYSAVLPDAGQQALYWVSYLLGVALMCLSLKSMGTFPNYTAFVLWHLILE